VAASNPAYERAFLKWVRDPEFGHRLWDEDELRAYQAVTSMRAAMSTTGANGGFLIPQQLDPTIVLTNDGTANPFRQIARVEQGFSTQWEGVSSSGVTAEWAAEAAEASDNTPAFTAPTVVAHRAQAYLFGSYEVLQDTNFEQQLPRLIGDAKDRLESAAFAVGSGSTAPFGVVTATTAITASRVTPTTGGTDVAVRPGQRILGEPRGGHARAAARSAGVRVGGDGVGGHHRKQHFACRRFLRVFDLR
jgi:HK97 family phage major capsid protein